VSAWTREGCRSTRSSLSSRIVRTASSFWWKSRSMCLMATQHPVDRSVAATTYGQTNTMRSIADTTLMRTA
jgi:hypothetical protein